MLRIKVTRSMTFARLGKTSLIWRPGTEVAIGLNSPRTSAGASGLGSKVSMCDGPPASQIRMQFRAGGAGRDRSAASGAEPEPVVQAQAQEAEHAGPQQVAAAGTGTGHGFA